MVGSAAHVGLEPALRHLLAQPQLLLAVPRYPEKEAGVMEGSARRPAYEFPGLGFCCGCRQAPWTRQAAHTSCPCCGQFQ